MKVIIVAGGQVENDATWQQWVRGADLVVGADGGAAQALSWGLVPQVVIGDMDSLPAGTRAELEKHQARFLQHPRAKDETDLELALRFAAEQGACEIIILGALGGRLDHTLSNVLLLALPPLTGIPVRIAAGAQEAILLRGGESIRLQGQPGDLVSLLPWCGDAQGVTTEGLAWPLEDEILRFGFSRGVSNEMTARQARVALNHGYLLVVHGPPPAD
ncbi:MAG: thiamine diphosphokinase [Anaerolineae bacterium]